MRKILKKLTVAMTASVVLISAFAGCVYDYNHEAVFTPPATPNMPYLLTQQTGVATAAQLMEVLDIAGLAFAFVDVNEGFVWTQSFGYADVASRTPVTEDTIFNIASTAKMFTAVAVMQLVEGGYLDLDTPVVYYLPEFRNLPHPIFGGNSDDITVRMLLTHTSGIHELLGNTGAFEAGGLDRDFMNNLIPLMQDLHLQNTQNNRATYANTGYGLLGVLVASIMGHENYFDGFVNFTDENIFAPLGMTNSSFDIEAHRHLIATPHQNASDAYPFHIYVGMTPTGGMSTTVADMARFMQAMLGGQNGVISDETIEYMARNHTAHIPYLATMPGGKQMGFGMMHLPHADGAWTTGHGGNLQHHTEFFLDFERGIGVFVVTNSTTGAPATRMLAETIWRTAVFEATGSPVVQPTDAPAPTQIQLSAEEMEALTGWYTMAGELAIIDGTLVFPAFTGVMPVALTPMSDGSFLSDVGSFWFEQVNDTMFVSLGFAQNMVGERIYATPATSAIEHLLGDWGVHVEGEFHSGITVSINHAGLIVVSFGGMDFIAEQVDNYTLAFLGRHRIVGSVATFEEIDGVLHMLYSGEFPLVLEN